MAYEELKARQSVVWGNGPYQRITETIADLQQNVTERLEPERGREVARSRLRDRRGRRNSQPSAARP